MGLGSLREGQLVRWNKSVLKLVGRIQNGEWLLADQESGLMDHQPEEALWLAIEREELRFICDSDALPPERSKRLLALLSGAATYGSTKKTDDARQLHALHRQDYLNIFIRRPWVVAKSEIEALWKRLTWPGAPPSRATLYNWMARSASSSDPLASLRSKDELKGRRVWYPERTLDVLRDVRDKHYLKKAESSRIARSKAPIRTSKALEYAQDALRLENLQLPPSDHHKIPGRRAMTRVINEVPEFERLALRFGYEYARKMMRTSLGGVQTTRPLERVECDHTLIAVILFDEDFTPWGRADMSQAVDAHTGCVPGIYRGAETDSLVSLAHCIRSSVSPKTDLLSKYPAVQGTLPCFGVAETYVFDNCFAAHSPAIRQACSELGGAIVEFCVRGKPWFKPNVERQFRTQDVDLFQTLNAATMENIVRRYEFNIKTDMLLRRSTFDRIHMKWLVDIYHRKPQAGLNNLSPIDAFKRDKGLMDQFIPSSTILLERMFLRDAAERSLDHEGIEFDCLIYNSAEMGALRSSLGAVLKVNIRVSDEDLGHIFVEVPGHDIWIRVPCLEQRYAKDLTRWQHEKCKKMKRMLMVEGYEVTLAESRQWILKEIELETEEFRLAVRKRSARFKERHGGAKPAEECVRKKTTDSWPGGAADKPDLPATGESSIGEECDIPELDVDVTEEILK